MRNDREFIELLQVGDENAWREFLEEARRMLEVAAVQRGLRDESRESCIAWVEGELFTKVRVFDPDGVIPFEGFLVTTVRRLVVDFGRKILNWQRKRPDGELAAATVQFRRSEDVPDPVEARSAQAEGGLDQLRRLVVLGLRHGSPFERLAFKLKFAGLGLRPEGDELDELARRVGHPPAAALAELERIEVESDGRRRTKPLAELLRLSPAALDKAASRMKLAIEGKQGVEDPG